MTEPLLLYLTALERRFSKTYWSLRLSNDSLWGITFLLLYLILIFLYLIVSPIRSIMSWIASYTLPSARHGVNIPFSMILWSSRSLANSKTSLRKILNTKDTDQATFIEPLDTIMSYSSQIDPNTNMVRSLIRSLKNKFHNKIRW